MNIDYPGHWRQYEQEGEVGTFRMKPPVLMYENDGTNARIVIEPIIEQVPAEESPVTAEKLREEYDRNLWGIPPEYIQMLIFAAMVAEGEVEPPHDSYPANPDLPVVFSDAPIDDERFRNLDWEVRVEYIEDSSQADEEMTRPASGPTPEVSLQFNNREQAIEYLEPLLMAGNVDFHLPADIS
ncbi:hypothetical protein [Haloarcula salinisoli]|uniref:Uncharacterized protein n=1 Tax=Haloarcula salinisoli TaxID=2487746 RepID=A0A8J7YLW1_9EURY|nr:hypothetical protein [Halomicroarcula salinisoli]MBX0305716.1 hypothetical protein [Halomicroarcula salinisoli]